MRRSVTISTCVMAALALVVFGGMVTQARAAIFYCPEGSFENPVPVPTSFNWVNYSEIPNWAVPINGSGEALGKRVTNYLYDPGTTGVTDNQWLKLDAGNHASQDNRSSGGGWPGFQTGLEYQLMVDVTVESGLQATQPAAPLNLWMEIYAFDGANIHVVDQKTYAGSLVDVTGNHFTTFSTDKAPVPAAGVGMGYLIQFGLGTPGSHDPAHSIAFDNARINIIPPRVARRYLCDELPAIALLGLL